jgi:rsbT co-antagonist protein RsbR
MLVSHFDIDALRARFEITDDDLKNIRKFGKIVYPKMDQWNTEFYDWLKTEPEFERFFTSEQVILRAQKMQRQYWKLFFEAEVNQKYLENRYNVGVTHAHLGLPIEIYMAGANKSQGIFLSSIYDNSLDPETYVNCCKGFLKLLLFDMAVAIETIAIINSEVIEDQSRVITEMSTPISEIWRDTLLLPLVGVIDSRRSQDLMQNMLQRISETHAKAFILDIAGVSVVDTSVANHLIKMVKASQLMGCVCLISGISPAIAQTIVELGIDTQDLKTTSTLRDALQIIFDTQGLSFNSSSLKAEK